METSLPNKFSFQRAFPLSATKANPKVGFEIKVSVRESPGELNLNLSEPSAVRRLPVCLDPGHLAAVLYS